MALAGEIMYLQGRRFAEGVGSRLPAFEVAAMQARSFLAAINALALVDKRNAWVCVPAAAPKALRVRISQLMKRSPNSCITGHQA
jgi:nuclear pore complex protein Nup160